MSMMIRLGILSPALAQMWENPCKARPDLKAQVDAGELSSVGEVEGPDFVAAVASSQLSPSSKPPPLGEEDTESPHRARDLWSCTYGAPNLIDGNPKTAWVERAKGTGSGEHLQGARLLSILWREADGGPGGAVDGHSAASGGGAAGGGDGAMAAAAAGEHGPLSGVGRGVRGSPEDRSLAVAPVAAVGDRGCGGPFFGSDRGPCGRMADAAWVRHGGFG